MSLSNDPQLINRLRNYLEKELPFYLDLLRQMVTINSFTANPIGVNQLGTLTAAAFTESGFGAEAIQCTTPQYGKHLVLTRPGQSERKIGLISHLDTVFPPDEELRHDFGWRPEGDRIYGPGTIDIKGGTVMIYMILAALQAIVPQVFNDITWTVLLNAAEETSSADFPDLCLERLAGHTLACLVFEMGHTREKTSWLVVARKGMALYRIKVIGRATHAGSFHARGASAILQMTKTIQQIESLTDYQREITFNVGTVAGGTVINRVPHYAVASGEMRAFDPVVYDQGLADLLSLSQQAEVRSPDDGYPCRVEINVFHQIPPWPRNQASNRLLELWQQAARSLGGQVQPEERGGLSDGNLIWPYIPSIDGLGPSGSNAHCSESSADGSKEQEYVEPASFVPKALLNTVALLKLIEQS
jgi:glutamate carboxypeptidase